MIPRLVQLVDFCRRRALWVALAAALATALLAVYTLANFKLDTDPIKLVDSSLPWRQREIQFDRLFPARVGLLVIVIDGALPGQADRAADLLVDAMRARADLFANARRPDGGDFFRRNGLLFLSLEALGRMSDRLAEAQPLLGALVADPTLRGLLAMIRLAAEGVARGETTADTLDRPFRAIGATIESTLQGNSEPLAWATLLTGREAAPEEQRRVIIVQPALDFERVSAGAAASETVRAMAVSLGLTPSAGITVRLTGPVALNDEEFSSVTDGALLATGLTLGFVILVLFAALGSLKIVVAILATLAVGLIATAAFAIAAFGTFNMVSISFGVLFIGLAVDFAIQFAVRYRDERHRRGDFAFALKEATARVAAPLLLAIVTTAAGFLVFAPVRYPGVSDLGLIAGVGMLIAGGLSFTLLPALIALFGPKGEPEPVGFAWAAGLDRFLVRWRRIVLGLALLLAAAGSLALPFLHFDFNPLNLKDQTTESVRTLLDLASARDASILSIEMVAPSSVAARDLGRALEQLPDVKSVYTVASFVPADQEAKLALIEDLAMLLEPTLTPAKAGTPAGPAALREALLATAGDLGAAGGGDPLARLGASLAKAAAGDDPTIARVEAALLAGVDAMLADLRLALAAERVTLASLPESLRADWVAPDGQLRIEVLPAVDTADNQTLARFVAAVRALAPESVGSAITAHSSGESVVAAFRMAGLLAFVAIAGLLALALRRLVDVLLVLAPLMLAGLGTVATSVAFGLPLNFANVFALPLLLGIGVAFAIYFVMNWRAGQTDPLQSPTARAVLYSALTTGAAFGSLALSPHAGTASMGLLLAVALTWIIVMTLLVTPALLAAVSAGQVPGAPLEVAR
ncbi:MAG: hypothetical protein EXQ87_00635 [Alphaproteobacteria bacterium]|nr:hypothetical protein [Alphaproteobacteria bacterium]